MGHIRVAIVEDQLQTREMLSVLVNGTDGYKCVAAYETAEAALTNIVDANPDIALVDIHLPGGISGIDCIKQLRTLTDDIQCIICTSLEDSDHIFAALQAGAVGYITKSTPPVKILDAITDAYNGGSPMSSQIARKVIGYFSAPPRINTELEKLSSREQELLACLAKGYRYKVIAGMLFISIETVRKHIHNIYEKLQVSSRTDALNKAYPKNK